MSFSPRGEDDWIRRFQSIFAARRAFDEKQAWVDTSQVPAGYTRVSVDAAVAGQHFPWPSPRPYDSGGRAMVAALSDLAAVGCLPDARVLCSVALPETELHTHADVAVVDALMDGAAACLARYGGTLVGGNVTRGVRLALHITVLGRGAVTRAGRGPLAADDLLWLTGTHGDAAAGLALPASSDGDADFAALRAAYWQPEPRFDWGRALWRRRWVVGVTDVSDGWARDTLSLAAPWRLGVELDPSSVPRSQHWRQVCARHPSVLRGSYWGGDDYELAFATRGLTVADIQARLRSAGVVATCVGRAVAQNGIRWTVPPAVEPPPGFGYDPYL